MISRTSGTPIMEAITIMKTAGRLFSNIEFITEVALTALTPVVMVVGGDVGVGPAAGIILEIFCKAFVALVNAAVVFSKALVVFSSLSLTVVADIAPPVTFVVVVFLMGSVAFGAGEAEVPTAAFSDNKLGMNNRDSDTRIITVAVFIYTLFVLFVV